jgi:hypothetical protein
MEANNQIMFKKMDEDKKEERDRVDKKILENNIVLIEAFAKMLGK